MARSRVIQTAEFDGYSAVVSRFEKSLQQSVDLDLCRPVEPIVRTQREIVYDRPYFSRGAFSGVRERRRKYGSSRSTPIPEVILHRAWRNAGLEQAEVRGRDGHTYRIIYGGKPGGSVGPDFTDAVIECDDGTVFRGDIEIHVREADWRAHGHHKDARYNDVVLHVVAAESTDSANRPALKATGVSIPLLALNWKSSTAEPVGVDPAVLDHDGERDVGVGRGQWAKEMQGSPSLLRQA